MSASAIRQLLTVIAWIGIFGLIVLTIVPASERPTTDLSHDIEHLLAFAVVGSLVGLSFRSRPMMLFAIAILFTAGLELLEIPLPSRHARLEDFFFDTVGAWIGLAIGRSMLMMTVQRKLS